MLGVPEHLQRAPRAEPREVVELKQLKADHPELASAIDMPDVFRTPQVLYFHLASAIGMASTAEIARLALYSLLTAAKTAQCERTQVPLPRRQQLRAHAAREGRRHRPNRKIRRRKAGKH